MIQKPKLIEGGLFTDHRGEMCFVNDFKVDETIRFYTIKHPDISVIRAWQGHQFEQKYFFPLSGSFLIAWVTIDDFENPSNDLQANYTILNANSPAVLHIPNGHANGLKALTANAMVGVFSDFDLQESIREKHRYAPDKWFNWHRDFNNLTINTIY